MTRIVQQYRRCALSTMAALALGAMTALATTAVQAQSGWPNKPVRIVVPFAPGGTTDILARALVPDLSAALGQQFIVDNRAGAGGNVGADIVAKSPGDGYTLLMGTVGTHGINRALYAKLPYDPIKDFVPITLVAAVPNVMVMNADKARQMGVKNVQDFIRVAKANPGKMNMASSGNGTSIHLAGELFKSMTGTDLLHVPYKGSAPAMTDLLGGQISIMFDNMPSAIQHVRSGKLRPIAVTTAKRSPELPDVPTIAEAGVPGYEAMSWFGMFAPATTPQPVLDKLNAALVKVLNQPDVKKKIAEQGGDVVAETPEQFAAFIKAETAKWGKVVKDSGATVD